jgi:hypothetical protein
MAATLLREAYDCIVLGSGRTASQIAAAVARTGQQTLQLTRESAAGQSWLQPRWDCYSEFAAGQRLPLNGVSVLNAAGKRITALRAAACAAPQQSASRHAAVAFTLPHGCRLTCDVPREIRLNGALPPRTIRANVVIAVRNGPNTANQAAIGGIYRDVSSGDNEERQATIFATQRSGEVFWLVPMAGALWSIGLLRSRAELSLAYETIADVFEDALVACPALTQRLISAQLVGGLHFSTATTQSGVHDLAADVLSLPDYSCWLDPVFASSDWLGDELATQFTQLLMEHVPAEKFAEWQQQWSAVEQLTRERIAPWYQQHEALTNALHDHAQREWYEKLLTGGPSRGNVGERRGVSPT